MTQFSEILKKKKLSPLNSYQFAIKMCIRVMMWLNDLVSYIFFSEYLYEREVIIADRRIIRMLMLLRVEKKRNIPGIYSFSQSFSFFINIHMSEEKVFISIHKQITRLFIIQSPKETKSRWNKSTKKKSK